MKSKSLKTITPDVLLIEPNVARDAEISLAWLEGERGKETLLRMGVPAKEIGKTSPDAEKSRVQDFLVRQDQLNWMIEYKKQVVGAVWVDLLSTNDLQAPAIHLMIGDSNVRGLGIGAASIPAVLELLNSRGHTSFYSRHLVANIAAARVLSKVGFSLSGHEYTDSDGLKWQNVKLEAS